VLLIFPWALSDLAGVACFVAVWLAQGPRVSSST
jgi:hypothetical protein